MKTIAIILLILGIAFIAAQVWIKKATNETETHQYEVVKDYGTFEIRQYEPALFSYTVMKSDSYQKVSGNGFRTLAGYIFGNNDKNQKIAMTSPVAMDMGDSVTMKFKVPEGMDMDALPKPNSDKVKFVEEPAKTVAAIRFGGKSTDEKIQKYTDLLKTSLNEAGIEYKGTFSYLGYNPPYEVIGRRNEVIVELVQ